MRTPDNARALSLLLAAVLAVMLMVPAVSMAAQATVGLGTTSSFAVLAGETITNTGPTVINGTAGGDVGVHPGNTFPGQAEATIGGAVHLGDAVALQAKNDLIAAYDDAAGRTPVTAVPVELGGTTLLPGVYSSGTLGITGTLTLDAQGDPDAVFIFQTPATLITAAGSRVNLINGARFCRVFWQVGTSATLGTDSTFVGHIFALQSIQAQTRATVEGQLLARNGSVTLDTNTISNGLCATVNIPRIAITKSANPTRLPSGGGRVVYTYTVTNPGTVALSGVTVTDDKISSVTRVSGDTNNDNLLQPTETWVYRGTANLTATTTNIATVRADAGGATASDTATVTVAVAGSPVPDTDSGTPVPETATGERLPDTSTPWYNVLFAGLAFAVVGAFSYWRTVKR